MATASKPIGQTSRVKTKPWAPGQTERQEDSRPGQLSARKNVDVQVQNRLAGIRAGIDDRAITGFFEPSFPGNSSRRQHQTPQQIGIGINGIRK